MFISKDSITISAGNTSILLGDYTTQIEFQYSKLWGEDSGRNLAGTQSGTFIGVFPKIIATFRKLSKTEMETVAKIIDSPYQTLTYYDPFKQANNTISTYTGDYGFINKNIVGKNSHKNESFSISFIAVDRRV